MRTALSAWSHDPYGTARAWIRRMGAARFPACAVVATMAVAGCAKKEAGPAVAAAPPSVVVAAAEQRDVVPYDVRTGSLAASQYVKILPRVNGFVETIPFTPGTFVKAGTVLFTLDAKPFKAALDQAEANLKAQEAALQNARDEADRQERLAKQDAATEKDLMNARNNLRAAGAARESAKAAAEAAKVNLDYCTISSPIDGKVDTNNVDVGDLVNMGGQKPLTTVAQIDPLKVNFTLPEDFIVAYLKEHPVNPQNRLAVPVKIAVGTENDFRSDATLDFVSNTLDQSTGTVAVQATVKNTDLKLYPGLFVRVKVNLSALKDAILVREDAVGRDIGGDYVWVIKPDNTAERRYLKLGLRLDNTRVVQAGMTAGETYVMQGMQRVRDGAKVTPKSADASASAKDAP